MVTFLIATRRLPGSTSITRSTSRNGYRCGSRLWNLLEYPWRLTQPPQCLIFTSFCSADAAARIISVHGHPAATRPVPAQRLDPPHHIIELTQTRKVLQPTACSIAGTVPVYTPGFDIDRVTDETPDTWT